MGERAHTHTHEELILARSQLWTPELDKLLRKWKKQTALREKGHQSLARLYSGRHYMFGVPATVLSTLITTGILATFRNCSECDELTGLKDCTGDETIRFIIGMTSIIGSGLTAFGTFMNYQGEAESHKSAADDYGALSRKFDTLLLLPGEVRGDPISTLQSLRTTYDDLIKRSPSIPEEFETDLTYEVINPAKYTPPNSDQIDHKGRKVALSPTAKSNLQDIIKDDHTEGTTRDDFEEMIAKENDYDTSDDEHEVKIAIDLDACTNSVYPSKRQTSLAKTLQFELKRLENQDSDDNNSDNPLSARSRTNSLSMLHSELKRKDSMDEKSLHTRHPSLTKTIHSELKRREHFDDDKSDRSVSINSRQLSIGRLTPPINNENHLKENTPMSERRLSPRYDSGEIAPPFVRKLSSSHLHTDEKTEDSVIIREP